MKKCPVRHAGRMGNFKPTYDVGEQNYWASFYEYHVVGQNFTLSQHAKKPTSLFVLSDTNLLASFGKEKRKYKDLICYPIKWVLASDKFNLFDNYQE